MLANICLIIPALVGLFLSPSNLLHYVMHKINSFVHYVKVLSCACQFIFYSDITCKLLSFSFSCLAGLIISN